MSRYALICVLKSQEIFCHFHKPVLCSFLIPLNHLTACNLWSWLWTPPLGKRKFYICVCICVCIYIYYLFQSNNESGLGVNTFFNHLKTVFISNKNILKLMHYLEGHQIWLGIYVTDLYRFSFSLIGLVQSYRQTTAYYIYIYLVVNWWGVFYQWAKYKCAMVNLW